ncbi:MAG: serine/threonine protein kinase [Acidobacteria bacterium]|nr:serine/threonine protein kinase [Acidobacteriota bacterium]
MLLKNRYKVISRLGVGGFGETFLAEDTDLPSRRRCVIKRLKPVEGMLLEEAQRLFAQEAQILEELGKGSQGRVPELYAYFNEGEDFYLAMEYVNGIALDRKVSQTGPLDESEVWGRILRALLMTLEYVHARKVIHRDIKPANIIIRNDGTPVLIDYGIVKRQLTTLAGGQQAYAQSRSTTGTEGYTPDEQWKGKAIYASDLYALGMTAIFALTGKSPTELHDLETGEFVWRRYAPRVSAQLAGVLDKVVRENYRERYATASEMRLALDQARPEDERTVQRPIVANSALSPRVKDAQATNEVKTFRIAKPPAPLSGSLESPKSQPIQLFAAFDEDISNESGGSSVLRPVFLIVSLLFALLGSWQFFGFQHTKEENTHFWVAIGLFLISFGCAWLFFFLSIRKKDSEKPNTLV